MRLPSIIALTVWAVSLFTACDKDNSYYERPAWRPSTIYAVLQSEGRFNHFLKCVDKTDYADILQGAGLYTVFAPNDEAFEAFLSSNNYATVDDIPLDTIKQLVAYTIVYSRWTSEHLADKFVNKAYQTGAFKRKTVLYTMPYQDPEFDNKWVTDETVPGGLSYKTSNYQVLLTMQNYKYLPVYTSAYYNALSLAGESDYLTFYPNSVFTGKNVDAGTILHEGINCENGMVHEVSAVSLPKKNMALTLQEAPYSVFKSLLDFEPTPDMYAFKQYEPVESDVLETFQQMMPGVALDQLYIKSYSASSPLAFSILSENVKNPSSGSYDSESYGNTLFVPQNDVLQQYIEEKVLKYYGSLNQLPLEVIANLINTHMVNDLVWPSAYQTMKNSTGEYLNGAGQSGPSFQDDGIVDKKVASNGFVYLIDHVIKSRFLETVYAEIYLNTAHQWLNLAYLKYFPTGLREDLMKSELNDYGSQRWTMLNFPDDLLATDGFTYDGEDNSFSNSIANADTRLQRLMKMHLFPGQLNVQYASGSFDVDITDFDDNSVLPAISQYENWKFLTNLNGDMVRYKTGKGMQAVGNIEDGTYVTLTKVPGEFNNGQIYNVDRLLEYTPRVSEANAIKEVELWTYLDWARMENPNVKTFVDYLERCIKAESSNALTGIKAENFYTVLMPNNTAMTQAINKGYLKPLEEVTTDNLENMAQATKFVYMHILQGRVLPDDGLKFMYPVNVESPNEVLLPTLYKVTDEARDLVNQQLLVRASKNASGLLIFTPLNVEKAGKVVVQGQVVGTTNPRILRGKPAGGKPDSYRSNRIASKAVLHELNCFFDFALPTN